MMEVHVLASGSDGNCTVIEHDGEAIMIDSGLSCKRIESLMAKEGFDPSMLRAVLITHEHTDHIGGVGPLARKYKLPVVANMRTFEASSAVIKNVQHWVYESNSAIDIGPFHVTPLPTSHDAVEPNAYFTETDGGKVLLATDTGKFTFPIEHALSQADVAVVESNYDQQMLIDGPYSEPLKRHIMSDRGHMCNVDTAFEIKKCMRPECKLFLAHLSKHNNTPDTARQTVSDITGIRRLMIDCLEFQGDTRTIRIRD